MTSDMDRWAEIIQSDLPDKYVLIERRAMAGPWRRGNFAGGQAFHLMDWQMTNRYGGGADQI